MELTTYFSDRQRFTLKSLWIPGTILAILGIISCFIIDYRMELPRSARQGIITASVIFMTLKWAIAFAWESILNKDYKKAVLISTTFFILNLAYIPFENFIYPYLPSFIDAVFIMIVWSCVQVAGICLITGRQNWWQIGIVAGLLICYTTKVPDSPLDLIRFYTFRLSDLVTDFFLPFMIYGWLYLAENFFNNNGYKDMLNSKTQVLSGKEYRFLYPLFALSCWMIIFQSAGLLRSHATSSAGYYEYSYFLSKSIISNAVTFVMEVSIFYITANLTRNIVISRMNTIANNNGWLYLLHYIPVVNIIIWIIFSNKPAQHTTQVENAEFYLTKRDASVNNYIIAFGVIGSIWSLYNAYLGTLYDPPKATAILFLVLFVKLINYFFLDKGKTAIILLIVLNCLTSLIQFITTAGFDRSTFALSMAAVLGYFFLVEIFHPELEKTE